MKRRIVMIILVLLCFLLQSTVMPAISIASIAPNCLLILTVSFALMRGKKEGMFVGFFGGLLIDLFFGNVLGFYTLLYTYVGYVNGFCYHIFYDDDIKMPILLIAASNLACSILTYVFQFLLRGRIDFFFYLKRIIIPEVIYTMILTMLCYRLLYKLNRKLEKAEQRSVDSFV
ncbi:MAG: rod shape-determining protein MreD [Lachnospiraceae bacterium]|jgi:rod shape-determining protein MreD|nr:rod shape-determining protein MreD [Lachnospiraceae bacterium]